MELKQAVEAIVGRPDLWAWRPTGEMFRITNNLSIQEMRTGKPRPINPKISDILTDDWLVGNIEALQKFSAEHWVDQRAEPNGE
jgi:hypothetical protein